MTEEHKVPEADQSKSHLTPNFFYDDQEVLKASSSLTDFDSVFQLYHFFGFDLSRRYNAIPLDQNTLVIVVGNYSMILDIATGEERHLLGHGSGVTCCAVHPTHEYVAMGEKGKNPYLCIYHYPSLKLFRLLKGGTEAAYSTVNFSRDGKMLAAVGTYPDFTLTVWDWEKETMILRAKAFSQDVLRVAFSDDLDGRLCTSGIGHIRMWEMARTFTGLKLQGEIGKFGNVEIADISGFSIFPDGKVLSGSESGSMLLWEDSLVKCQFVRSGKNGGHKLCHRGNIEVIYHRGSSIVTAGVDGKIRIWKFTEIDTGETEDTSQAIVLKVNEKIKLSENSSVKCMYPVGGASEYIIVDEKQGIWRADLEKKQANIVRKFHAGKILAIAFSPRGGFFVSGGADGYLRLWDIAEKKMKSELSFDYGISSILWIYDSDKETIFVGFEDGCLRVIVASANGLVLVQPLKPHTAPIRDIKRSPTSKLMATTGDDGSLFFLNFENGKLSPLGFTYINGKKPKSKEEITKEATKGYKTQDDKVYACGLSIRWGSVISVDLSDNTIASVATPTNFPSEGTESFFMDLPIESNVKGPTNQDITAKYQMDDGTEVRGTKDGVIKYGNYERQIHSGAITCICASDDSIFICTASENGEIMLFKQSATRTRFLRPEMKEVQVAPVEDIKKGGYSIEEEKQKSELDKRIAAAEQQKNLVRKQIESIRQKFAAIVTQNQKAPLYMQLGNDAFKLDPFLFELQEEKAQALEKQTKRDLMFDLEKERLRLRKIKSRLLRDMLEESFTVASTDGETKVSSFRICDIKPLIKEIEEINDEQPNESNEESLRLNVERSPDMPNMRAGSKKGESREQKIDNKPKKTRSNRTIPQKPLEKVVHDEYEHTKKRKLRDERLEEIKKLEPPSNYFEPQDEENIRIAKETRGEYMLKSDPKYIAPENDRVNATKKKRQLIKLVMEMQKMKMGFNKELKELAELKNQLQISIDETNDQLMVIRETIGYDANNGELIHIKNKQIEPLDLRENIDISVPTPEAVSFAAQVAAAARRRNDAQAGKQKQSQPSQQRQAKRKQQQQQKKKKAADEGVKYSEIELNEMDEVKSELKFKSSILIRNIKNAIKKFDERLEQFQSKKLTVQTEIILAELRFILMLREFKLLAKLELKDSGFNEKLKEKGKEISGLMVEKESLLKKFNKNSDEIKELESEIKKFSDKFNAIVPKTHSHHEALKKIFGYNLRRDKDKMKQEEEEVDLNTMDVEAVKKIFEKKETEKEEDIFPEGCEKATFEKVLDLREERMDFDDKLSDARSMESQISNQIKQLQKNIDDKEKDKMSIKKEFDSFQHQKQKHLNKLNFSLSIQFHQIKNLVERAEYQDKDGQPYTSKSMPSDLSDSLIFTQSGLNRLADIEKKHKNDQNEAKKKKLEIENSTRNLKTKVLDQNMEMKSKKETELAEIQRLKFGEPVDLVELEKLKVNKDVDQLEAQIKKEESQQEKEMKSINAEINEITDQLTKEIQKNTVVLGYLVDLTDAQREIEGELQNSRKTQTADEISQDLELKDPNELLQEVQKNNDIIEKLEEEINILKRR